MKGMKKLWLGWMGMGREMGWMGWDGLGLISYTARGGCPGGRWLFLSWQRLLALGVERARLHSMSFGFPLFERMMRVCGYQGTVGIDWGET